MAEVSLPATLDFSKKLPSLPDGVNSQLLCVQATNGIKFEAGQVAQFDLPARSGLFLDGRTAFIRYKVSFTSGATAGVVRRKPAYTFISKLDEFIGGTPVSSVYQYNQVANMFIDTNFSMADVQGQAYSFGLDNATWADVDGVAGTASGDKTLYVSAPLVCSALGSCDKLLPTGLMGGNYRVQLTFDTITNIFTVPANVSAFTITQPELCIQAIDMPVAVENMVASMGQKLYIKASAWSNSSQSASSTSAGYYALPFNHRYESIENLYLLSTCTVASKAVNTIFDSFNPMGTAGTNGSLQFQIGNSLYPLTPINNSTGGVASVQQYLRACAGEIADQRNTMSITYAGFTYTTAGITSAYTSATDPAKFIVGIPLSKIASRSPYTSSALLSGVSATQSPINVLLNAGSASGDAVVFNLISEYTALIEIDPVMKQVQVVC